MTQAEVRENFHNLIDELKDENLLAKLYNVMITLKENQKETDEDWWNLLTEEQKTELDMAIKESEDENNLISHEQVMQESKEWLKK